MSRKSVTSQGAAAREPASVSSEQGPLRWLDLLPVVWLVLVLSAFAILALYPIPGPRQLRDPIAGLAEVERVALPLLAALLVAGIIRYSCARSMERKQTGSGRARPPGRGPG